MARERTRVNTNPRERLRESRGKRRRPEGFDGGRGREKSRSRRRPRGKIDDFVECLLFILFEDPFLSEIISFFANKRELKGWEG